MRDFGDTSPVPCGVPKAAPAGSLIGETLAPQREQNAEPSFNCVPHLLQNNLALL